MLITFALLIATTLTPAVQPQRERVAVDGWFDARFETDHNPSGMRSLWRRVAGLALVPWLAVSGMVPPEHVHEAGAAHPFAITHRHFEAHDHDGTEISHGEGGVVWLDNVAVEHARIQVSVALAVLALAFDAVPPATLPMAVMTLDAAPPHGPPRAAASLRAPPTFPLA